MRADEVLLREEEIVPAEESLGDEGEGEVLLDEATGSSTMKMKIIKPGWGSSGFYPADVLKTDGPAAWPAGTHMYLDHPTVSEAKERPERSIKDLAAITISDPVYEESGPKGPGLYAHFSVLPQYKETIKAIAPFTGVSIRAHGSFKEGEAEGRTGRVITRINKGESIDFVTKPGAGGQVLAIMESLRQTEDAAVLSSTQQESHDDTLQQEASSMELKEAQDRIAVLESELKTANDKVIEESTRGDRAEGALAILEAQAQAAKLMVNVSLPDAARARVIHKVAMNPPMTEGKLDVEKLAEAVEAEAKVEAEYLESLGVTGKVTDQGATTVKDEAVVTESLSTKMSSLFNLTPEAAKIAAKGR